MTMARVKDGKVVEVGLPDDLRNATSGRLYHYGWRPVLGKPKPVLTEEEMLEGPTGFEYTKPYTYDPEKDAVYGSWNRTDVKERVWREAREKASLTRAEFKLALLDMGELDNVKAAMEAPDLDPRVKILWEDSLVFKRTDGDLLAFADAMGYTEKQLDILFGIVSEDIEEAQ